MLETWDGRTPQQRALGQPAAGIGGSRRLQFLGIVPGSRAMLIFMAFLLPMQVVGAGTMAILWFAVANFQNDDHPWFFQGAIPAACALLTAQMVGYRMGTRLMWRANCLHLSPNPVSVTPAAPGETIGGASSLSTSGAEPDSCAPAPTGALAELQKKWRPTPQQYERDVRNLRWIALINISVLPIFVLYWVITIFMMYAKDSAVAQSLILSLFYLANFGSRMYYRYNRSGDRLMR